MSTETSYPERGHVETGGPAATRQVDTGTEGLVEIRKLSVGPMDNNCYVLISGDEALVIDAANDAERILEEVKDLDVVTIMTTHGHQDHWQALAAVAEATGAEVVYHPADDDMIPVEADRHVDHGVELSFGSANVRLIHNPGHTPGSTSVLLGDAHLFTGDTLFPGGPGNTFGSAEAFDVIMNSLETEIFGPLDDDVWVYPGHGDDTTLGAERPSLGEWRERGW